MPRPRPAPDAAHAARERARRRSALPGATPERADAADALALASAAPIALLAPGRAQRLRLELADGASTTVHLAAFSAVHTEVKVAVMRGQRRLLEVCAARGVADALVGGFFVRPDGLPLGEVRTHGVARRHVPFTAPWHRTRGCLHVEGGVARIHRRDELPLSPRGHLLQAGPVLVRDGRPVFDREADAEGFRRGAAQFDSDITDGRHPRAAIGLAGGRLLALACDGRSRAEAGLSLDELAALLCVLGCDAGLNLDGGGSTSLVVGGRLRNRPRGGFERPEHGGRPISTALLFVPR
jgi:hypothetical protein